MFWTLIAFFIDSDSLAYAFYSSGDKNIIVFFTVFALLSIFIALAGSEISSRIIKSSYIKDLYVYNDDKTLLIHMLKGSIYEAIPLLGIIYRFFPGTGKEFYSFFIFFTALMLWSLPRR